MKNLMLFIVFSVFWGNVLIAQDFTGSYTLLTETGTIQLEFEKISDMVFSGKLSRNGNVFPLKGSVQNNILAGHIGSELDGLLFNAYLNENELVFTMFESDANESPIASTSQILKFQRARQNTESTSSQLQKSGAIVINNINLSKQQIEEIKKTYGTEPLPGKYWYDAKSGLYGVVGYQAFGFMYAGHQWGQLDRKASAGNTGVIINNRELPQNEYLVWSYILGYWIQPGSYWLDDKGNAGIEGNPVPVVNLFVAAKQNAYQGRGGSGDNFWSSRFSAGNYDSDN